MGERRRVILVLQRLGVRDGKELEPGGSFRLARTGAGLPVTTMVASISPALSFSIASLSLRLTSCALTPRAAKIRFPVIAPPLPGAPKFTYLPLSSLIVVHVGTHEDVHLLVEQLGDVGDLRLEVRPELAGAVEMLEQVGLGDAHIDAAQEHHVFDVLLWPFADHGQDAQIIAVVENLGEVLDDGKVGSARASGHDRHHVLVDAESGKSRACS